MLAHKSSKSFLNNGVNFDFTCCIKRFFYLRGKQIFSYSLPDNANAEKFKEYC